MRRPLRSQEGIACRPAGSRAAAAGRRGAADQRLRRRRSRRRAKGSGGKRRAPREGYGNRPRGRADRHDQGQCSGEGPAEPARHAHERRYAGDRGFACDSAIEGSGLRHSRQDHAAGDRLEGPRRQSALWRDPQSLEDRPYDRRLLGRRRGCRRSGARAFSSGHGRARLDPHTRRLHRRVRAQAQFRPCAGLSAVHHGRARPSRPADAARRGRRLHAVADRPARQPRQYRVEHALRRLHRKSRQGRARPAHRMVAAHGLCRLRRSRRRGGDRESRESFCGTRRERRRSRSADRRSARDCRRSLANGRGGGDETCRRERRASARPRPARGGEVRPRSDGGELPRRISRARKARSRDGGVPRDL